MRLLVMGESRGPTTRVETREAREDGRFLGFPSCSCSAAPHFFKLRVCCRKTKAHLVAFSKCWNILFLGNGRSKRAQHCLVVRIARATLTGEGVAPSSPIALPTPTTPAVKHSLADGVRDGWSGRSTNAPSQPRCAIFYASIHSPTVCACATGLL